MIADYDYTGGRSASRSLLDYEAPADRAAVYRARALPPVGAVPSARPTDLGGIYSAEQAVVVPEYAPVTPAPAPYVPASSIAAPPPSATPDGSGVGAGGTTVPSASPTGGDAILGRLADLFAASFGAAQGDNSAGSTPVVITGGTSPAVQGVAAASGGIGRAALGVAVLAALVLAGVWAYRKARPKLGAAAAAVVA